ncbi:MAG TPA: 2OG-Fe(II) oxygenase [Dongiaceae bacterium]
MSKSDHANIARRLAAFDWAEAGRALDESGYARIQGVLTAKECTEVASWYGDDARFRSTVIMARHGFGDGEYKYFAYPLPPLIDALRREAYPALATVANRWAERLGDKVGFPATLDRFTQQCHAAGQKKPTPLVLRYDAGGYNRLHQDLYGAIAFPIQMAILLSRPGADFDGGEFILAEQRPRMQSRAEVVAFGQGDAVLFAVNERPVAGSRGYFRARMRHGVSTIRTGHRATLGIIFHDAA